MSSYTSGLIRTSGLIHSFIHSTYFPSVGSNSGIIYIGSCRFQLIKFERFKLNTTLAASSTEAVEFSKGILIVDLDVKLKNAQELNTQIMLMRFHCHSTVVRLCPKRLSNYLSKHHFRKNQSSFFHILVANVCFPSNFHTIQHDRKLERKYN